MDSNLLYCGDNLKVLRVHIADESVDVVYLDQPFKSDQNDNVLFSNVGGQPSETQIHAFDDTRHWHAAAVL